MLNKIIPTTLATMAIAVGLSFGATGSANAAHKNFGITLHGDHGSLTIGNHGHRYKTKHKKHRYHRVCHPGKAVRKAEHRGLHHVRVKRVGDRFVVVKGRKRGRKIKIAFYRDSPRCEVAWVKRINRNHNYGYDHYGYGY